jgi:serine protease Do
MHKYGQRALIFLLIFGGYFAINSAGKRPLGPLDTSRAASLPDFVPAALRFAPSLVHIETTFAAAENGDAGNVHSAVPPPARRGIGSGIIIQSDGHILTNYHVVESANKVLVRLADRRVLDAVIVGRDAKSDLALIKIAAPASLKSAPLGDSSIVRAGDWVIAMGSPFGLDRSLTAGIVSAKSRRIGAGPYDYIQTDASINPGNSGGPLLNLQGRVVGINTAIFSHNGSDIGVNFAIPINRVKDFLPELRTKGKITRGWLGVSTRVVSPQIARWLNLTNPAGALVVGIAADGPAAGAGLALGDVIVGYDGRAILDADALPALVAATPVGRAVTLYVSRHGLIYRAVAAIRELQEVDRLITRPGISGINSDV